ncbi:MAG: hypothetical protein ACREMB_20970 [Candidatus Rokuibacteriota bacterium]
MVRASVLYPHRDGARFDHEYHARQHLPMVLDRLRAFGMAPDVRNYTDIAPQMQISEVVH